MLNFMPVPDNRKRKNKKRNNDGGDDDDDEDGIATVDDDDVRGSSFYTPPHTKSAPLRCNSQAQPNSHTSTLNL